MSARESKPIPIPLQLASDLLGFIYSVLPVTVTYLLLGWMIYSLYPSLLYLSLFILFFPYIASLTLLSIIFIFRLTIPKMKVGAYRVGLNKGFLSWSLNFYIGRTVALSGLKNFIMTNTILRFIYVRVMGSKISFQITGSMGVDFIDLPLIEVGKGCTLSEGVAMSAHTFTGDSLLLSAVKIGENVFLGMDVMVGPGTHIGTGTWVGARNAFIRDKIPAGSYFPTGAWENGNPEKNAKSDVILGPLKGKATKE